MKKVLLSALVVSSQFVCATMNVEYVLDLEKNDSVHSVHQVVELDQVENNNVVLYDSEDMVVTMKSELISEEQAELSFAIAEKQDDSFAVVAEPVVVATLGQEATVEIGAENEEGREELLRLSVIVTNN